MVSHTTSYCIESSDMCLALVADMTVGCYKDSSDQLKEQLVGAWDMSGNGERYAYFYPDGEMAFYDVVKDRLVISR